MQLVVEAKATSICSNEVHIFAALPDHVLFASIKYGS